MPLRSRVANVLRRDRLSCDIDEELGFHLEEAGKQGGDPAEVRRAGRAKAEEFRSRCMAGHTETTRRVRSARTCIGAVWLTPGVGSNFEVLLPLTAGAG